MRVVIIAKRMARMNGEWYMQEHMGVLIEEAITVLAIKPAGKYIDATFGRGGHTSAILECLNQEGQLLALDRDPSAIDYGQKVMGDERLHLMHCAFAQLIKPVLELDWKGQVDGVLFDLGVSSPQLDEAERGFSFQHEGPLDMRMDPTSGVSAAQWLAGASAQEIADVLYQYGEERYSRRIARYIVEQRKKQPIITTTQLANIIKTAHPRWEHRIHPATRSFQAIRIFINSELQELGQALQETVKILSPAGRLVVISFHSLEDRLVKRFLRQCERETPPLLKRIGKFIKPSQAEIASNPRARSAIMRVGEKAL